MCVCVCMVTTFLVERPTRRCVHFFDFYYFALEKDSNEEANQTTHTTHNVSRQTHAKGIRGSVGGGLRSAVREQRLPQQNWAPRWHTV